LNSYINIALTKERYSGCQQQKTTRKSNKYRSALPALINSMH